MHQRIPRNAAVAVALLSICSLASAQFSTVGPFTGNSQEGFETQDTSADSFPVCIADRVFNGQGDLCAENGTGGAHITGGWGFSCSIQEQAGVRLFGCTSGPALYTFDTAATRFGGYFGTNNPTGPDGTIEFLDAGGAVLHADVLTVPADCTWNWHGWDSGGALFSAVRVTGVHNGGYMLMDSMEADILPDIGAGAFCFCDGSGTPAPCGNPGSAGNGCANSVNASGAHLVASGISSLSSNSFLLHGSGLVPNQPGLYFQGNNAANGGLGNLLGDGLRCAGGNVLRIQIVNADASGDSSLSADIVSGQIIPLVAGDTRRYQLWYRDPSGSPCGSNFNLTNGVETTWLP